MMINAMIASVVNVVETTRKDLNVVFIVCIVVCYVV